MPPIVVKLEDLTNLQLPLEVRVVSTTKLQFFIAVFVCGGIASMLCFVTHWLVME